MGWFLITSSRSLSRGLKSVKYVNNILRLSNSCIYINDASSVDDEDSVLRIKKQYETDKSYIYKTISEVEKDVSSNKINLCFFSGKYFFDYLEYYKKYVKSIEEEPIILLHNIWEEYSNSWHLKGIKNLLLKKLKTLKVI